MVGDTTHDADVARSMGVSCVLIADGHQSFRRLSEAGVPVYESLLTWAAGWRDQRPIDEWPRSDAETPRM